MTEPVKPGWPEAGAFPFMPFPLPGATGGATAPMLQGFAGGMDLFKDFWSRLPGSAAVPGFMVPTVDVEELDRRIGDLKAAERWVEVNLTMLRTTIQGLEVQRHTIAALQSLTTPTTPAPAAPAAATSSLPPGWPAPPAAAEPTTAEATTAAPPAPASNDWLAYLQTQFTKVAQAAITPAATGSTASGTTEREKPAKKAAPRSRKATASR